jgi:Uma2 family endonuclease
MHAAGILTEDDRVELLDGEIVAMSPIGPLHAAIVNRLTQLLNRQLPADIILSIQNPVQLDDYNQPQPDLLLLHHRADFYASAHPVADDVVLLVEVSDSSANFDRDAKLPRYAQAGIGEVWLADVAALTVEQYREPRNGRYRIKVIFEYDDTLTLIGREITVRVAQIFG